MPLMQLPPRDVPSLGMLKSEPQEESSWSPRFRRLAIHPRADLSSLRADDFVRRPALERCLDELRSDQDCRIVLLTGVPGSGKSAFLANLALREPSCLCHFIRRDHQTRLQSGDAKTLLLNVGKQFSRRYPDIFATEQVQINAKVVSRRVESLGEVVGAKIGSLIANPFRATSIAATVEVEEVEGRVTSVEIDRLIEDGRLLPVADLLRMGLLDPLAKLERRGSGERITILIDALDETRFSQGPDDAISFLSTLPELPGMFVRMIATSRPDAAIVELLRRSDVRHIPLDRGDLLDENSSTMSTLIRASTGNLGPEFVQSLVAKAQGNFLYARARSVVIRTGRAASRGSCPPGKSAARPSKALCLFHFGTSRLLKKEVAVWLIE